MLKMEMPSDIIMFTGVYTLVNIEMKVVLMWGKI